MGSLMQESSPPMKANDIFPPPQDSIIPHVALYATQLLALASPKFPGRRYIFSSILIALFVQAQLHPFITDSSSIAQPFCIQWGFMLATLEKLLLSGNDDGPESHFWRKDVGKAEAESYSAFSVRKVEWAIALLINSRGVGWNHEVKNIPPQPAVGKVTFVRKQLVRAVVYYALADLFAQLVIWFFYTNPETGIVGDVNSKLVTLDFSCPGWIFVTRYAFAAALYFGLSFQYTFFSILGVSLGFGGPEDWPPVFNSISEATTVRNVWGKFWHQMLRRPLSTWANALVDVLGIQHGSNLSSYTQIWFSFLVSGYLHASSHLILPSPVNVTVAERTYLIFLFFVLQAAAITLEDAVQWMWCKSFGYGQTRWRRAVGYAWVLGWLVFSVKFPAEAYLKTRVGVESPLPFTIVGPWVHIVPRPF